jgi:hypothetical protein
MLKMGASALTGDKGGLASGLASQFGAGDSTASMLGSVAGGDMKGALLGKLAGATGLDPKLLQNVSNGKIDPMQLAGAAGFDPKSMLGGAADKLGVSALTKSVEQNIKGARDSVTDKYLKDASGKTLLGADNAPIKNPAYDQVKADALAIQQQSMGEMQDMQKKLQDQFKTKTIPANAQVFGQNADEESFNLQQSGSTPAQKTEQPWTLDRIIGNVKREAGQAVDKVKGAGSAVAGIAKSNPNLTEGLIQGAGAVAGYAATDASNKKQQEILKRQEQEAQQIREMEKFQYDPRRAQAYDQSYGFQQERIAQGGFTAAEAAQQKADDLRSAKMRQAARMAGVRTLAEKGQGATGSGDAYRDMLAGMQEASDVGSQLDLARQKQAAENLEKSYAALPEMMEKKTTTEMSLAQQRSAEDVNRANQLAAVRASQTAAEQRRGEALANLASKGTDVVSGLVKNALKPEEAAKTQPQTQPQTQQQPQAQSPTTKTTTSSTAVKAGAAAQVAGNRPPAEMATGEFGSGAGVLATPNADAMNQALSRSTPVAQPKSGVQQLLSGDLLKQGQQLMSKAPAPVQQAVNSTVDKAKEQANKTLNQFGIKF